MASGIDTKREAPTASEALRHPIRVRILETLNKVDMSPVQFLNSGVVDEITAIKGKTREAALSHISYHFRVLVKAGCIEIVETIPRRGSVEHVYRGKARAQFDEQQWAELDVAEREEISKVMLQGFVAQAEGSMLSGMFDLKPERWLAYFSIPLDEQGWGEMVTSLENCWAELEEIRQTCSKRLDDSGEEEEILATFGLFGFESPPLPKPRNNAAA
jgi:DNA-binding transcriptional ArsR family regulator